MAERVLLGLEVCLVPLPARLDAHPNALRLLACHGHTEDDEESRLAKLPSMSIAITIATP